MANSHPGSYCGQDAYSDMLVTEKQDGICSASTRALQGNTSGICPEGKGSQRCHGFDYRGGVVNLWKKIMFVPL